MKEGMMRKMLFAVLVSITAVLTLGGTPDQGPTVRFSHPDIISYDHQGFMVHGKRIFIYSGSFHYFRCDTSEWMDRLEKIKAAGFNAVETYIPWNWHEREEGKPDFRELDKFLNDCSDMGLYVIARPGPYICAEWNIGGFPDWLEGKHVGFRTASPQDIQWSKYWYDEVLPVIRRHLITNGGSVILMQIENEYDYFSLPDSDKKAYLISLYETAMKNGIDVPIITCWTSQSRDNTDSVFSQVMDACNFYPSWNIESTLPSIERLKSEEPASPPMVTELQGGWFSSVGEKSVRRVNDFGPDQVSALTDFVIAHGIKALNYYMLYGGTNFGYWGSQDKTTSYDYTAPISEPGGLWDKYRAVKLLGDFIRLEGKHLVDSREVKNGAYSDTPGIETLLRTDGTAGFLLVGNKTAKTVVANVRFKPPQGSEVTLKVKMRPKGSYLLPVDLPLPGGGMLHYTNVPVSAISEHNGKPLIIAYGNPGDEATIYAGSSLCTEEIGSTDKMYNWDGLYVLLTTFERAARSRVFDTPAGKISIVFDSYLATEGTTDGGNLTVNLQTRPGEDHFSLFSHGKVRSVSIDGKSVGARVDPRTQMTNFSLNTPPARIQNVHIEDIRASGDGEAPAVSDWTNLKYGGDTLAPLESEGDVTAGYTVYEGEFSTDTSGLIKANYYDNDWHSILVDGETVPGLTGSGDEDISKTRLPAGKHTIEIIYENRGWPNGGNMEGNKGLKSISLAPDGEIMNVDSWKHAPAPSPYPAGNVDEASPTFNDSKWESVNVGHGNQPFIMQNEGWWFKTRIRLSDESIRENATLTFKAVDDNALVYVNGKLAEEHKGYDTPFTIPLSEYGIPGDNVVAVYVQNQGGGGGIWMPVVLKWGRSLKIDANLKFHHSLPGHLAGWEAKNLDSSRWKSAPHWEGISSADGITWYRGEFKIPSKPGWVVPWHLHIESTGSGQIWINGRLLGRFFQEGPQKDFYLPNGWLQNGVMNSIVLVLRAGESGGRLPEIRDAYIAPYEEYVVQKHTLKVIFK